MNKLNNSKGISLVETLAVVIILSIISIFIFNIVAKVIENSNAIQMENQLRDEADIMMSKLFKVLYATNQTHIVRNVTNSNAGSYIEVTNDLTACTKNANGSWNLTTACLNTLKPIGFVKNGNTYQVRIIDEIYTPGNKVEILPTSTVVGDPATTSIYKMNLQLKIVKTRGNQTYEKTMNFENDIQAITF